MNLRRLPLLSAMAFLVPASTVGEPRGMPGPAPAEAAWADPTYEKAILSAKTGPEPGHDWRGELHTCVQSLGYYDFARVPLWKAIREQKRLLRPGSVLLEVAGSTWPGYAYVLIDQDKLVEDLHTLDPATETKLWKRIDGLAEVVGGRVPLQGDATAFAFDAECYFLTVRTASGIQQAAVYAWAPSGSIAARIIKDLASLATRIEAERE